MRSGTKLLCVDFSEDVLALLRELLRQAGYSPVTTSNLFDARVLAKATRPALVLAGPTLGPENVTMIQGAVGDTAFLALEETFANLEPSEAAEHLLTAVKSKLAKN